MAGDPGAGLHVDATVDVSNYIRQVNGVRLADILFSLLCVSVRVCLRALGSSYRLKAIKRYIKAVKIHLADICTL